MRRGITLLHLVGALLIATLPGVGASGDGGSAYIQLSVDPKGLSTQRRRAGEGETPTTGDVSAMPSRTGSLIIVRVSDEKGVECAGAKVYHNGRYVGLTGETGTISIPEGRAGDTLAALVEVHEQPSPKRHHELGGTADWAWRVYQTSVPIADNGSPQLYEVTDPTEVQQLMVRADQPLVGFHMVACVEWDADSGYLADLRESLERASAFLYDVGDGQFLWEMIEIFDNRPDPTDCDMRVVASNQQWPRGHIDGITRGRATHIIVGRHFDGNRATRGDWASERAYRALVHEFGHYGLGIWDEYPKELARASAPQAGRSHLPLQPRCESIMDDPYTSNGLCSRADPNYEQGLRTDHAARMKGELSWETVLRRFGDRASPSRWTLRSPVERGSTLPGPHAIPVDGWVQVTVTDEDTGACPSFRARAIGTDGVVLADAEVWMTRPGRSLSGLDQGRTDGLGQVTIYGACPGDSIRISGRGSWGAITVDCSETLVWENGSAVSGPGPRQDEAGSAASYNW